MTLEIAVEGEGLAEVEIIRLPEGGTGKEIVIAVAGRGGYPAEEGLLFLEDRPEPLDLALVLVETEVAGKVHHVHRARQLEVGVFYKGEEKNNVFPPSARVQRVLDWAIGKDGFNIDKTIAPEMELALHGTETALPKNAHIGRYVRHPHHTLKLDLIRGVVPNGEDR